MARNKVLYRFLFLLAVLTFSSCSSRYGYIPRTFQLTKAKPNQTGLKGHYVSKTPSDTVKQRHFEELVNSVDAEPKIHENQQHVKVKTSPKISFNKAFATDTIDSDTVLSAPPQKVDKKLFKESNALFAIATAANLAYLLAAEVSFLAISILIGLGLIILIYAADSVIMDLIDTRSKPLGPVRGFDPRRESIKKGFQVLMLIAGILFTLALLVLALTIFEEIAIVLAVFGAIAFYAGLLTGLTYLITGLIYR